MRKTPSDHARARGVPRAAAALGYCGALPFVGASLGALLLPPGLAAESLRVLIAYGAIILSFMGAVHWGVNMTRNDVPAPSYLAASVVPALIGWVALLLPARPGLALLAMAFVVLLGCDVLASRSGMTPAWYPGLRWPLTLIVAVSLLLALFA